MNYIIEKTERKKKMKKATDINYSIESIHSNKMIHFKDLQENILPLKMEQIKVCISNFDIKVLSEEIKDIQNKKEEIDYFNKVSDILSRYLLDPNNRDIIIEYYIALSIPLPLKYQNTRINPDICPSCNFSDCMYEDEMVSCINCGVVNGARYSKVLAYKEKQENYSYQPSNLFYKRLDYFKQWLNQIQGRENSDTPQKVIDEIILELKVERIKDITKLPNSLIKRLLKKTGNSKYYEHIPSIKQQINGVKPLCIPSEIQEIFINMFIEVEKIWEDVKIEGRSSFFSTPYVLHKFSQILGLTEYLPYFPMLKSREKVYKQDVMWKKVINIFNSKDLKNEFIKNIEWKFISSL